MTANKSKQDLRRELVTQRRSLSPNWIAEQSDALTDRISQWQLFKQANSVMLYLAMADEPQMDGLISLSLNQGKSVSVPALTTKYGYMEAALITSFEDLVIGKLGLRMPDLSRAQIADPATMDLVLVPGVAFDHAGNRLGMGAGYYDRFLARAIHAKTAGVIWDVQLVSAVIREDHDVPVQYVITEQQILLCKRGKI